VTAPQEAGERVGDSTLIVTEYRACDAGCCVATYDGESPWVEASNHSRPMYQVFLDAGEYAGPDPEEWRRVTMRVKPEDYDQPNRILL
jgi:hypothetical protein